MCWLENYGIWLACFLLLCLQALFLSTTHSVLNFEKRKMVFFGKPFKIKSPVGALSKQHLEEYQAGEAVGYTVDCKDGSFQVHKWCLYNSDFLLTMHKGTILNKSVTLSIWSYLILILNHSKLAKILKAKERKLSIWKNFEKHQFE